MHDRAPVFFGRGRMKTDASRLYRRANSIRRLNNAFSAIAALASWTTSASAEPAATRADGARHS
jgi:hypothetical protein